MDHLLDLSIILSAPPSEATPETIASIEVQCEQLGLFYPGTLFVDPLTEEERVSLQWYLEEYWKWPYEAFAERGWQVEGSLRDLGKRLYQTLFDNPKARDIVAVWRLHPEIPHQVSIVSTISRALSLPWELLHDEQGFLILSTEPPISLVRRLFLSQSGASPVPFEPPLHVLLVTARPDGSGFINPRSIAQELVDTMQGQVDAGNIVLEFLRPPTLSALRARLKDHTKEPIHVLHFDGHGTFADKWQSKKQGMLAFEDAHGQLNLVSAEEAAQVLQHSGVRLVLLTACQSAMMTANDAFSSVASRLMQEGVDAVIAMSANVLVASTVLYTRSFYRSLAAGISVSEAHEQARRALHNDPRRHPHRRYHTEAGTPVVLHDWWLPHLYQQRHLILRPSHLSQKQASQQRSTPLPRLDQEMLAQPLYGFSGRALELLRLERWLQKKHIVIIHGFGGIGKTTLACEAARWLTQTNMYAQACFISFEHGGDAIALLSTLGHFIGTYDANYVPEDLHAALTRLAPLLKKQSVLVIIDSVECILPGSEAPLEIHARITLWKLLLDLAEMGVGILLTSRDGTIGDGRFVPGQHVARLDLGGLLPEDAYALASYILRDLNIEPGRVPYIDLGDLLDQLGYHPLAIQLVLPALREHTPSAIRSELVALLPAFVGDVPTGRNQSLSASLEYSLRSLSAGQQKLLSHLTLFEGRTTEEAVLAILEIPKQEWNELCSTMERLSLFKVVRFGESYPNPLIYFHPVLSPFLRSRAGSGGSEQQIRYAQYYHSLSHHMATQYAHSHPQFAHIMLSWELPNMRRAMLSFLEWQQLDLAARTFDYLFPLLTEFGLWRGRDMLLQKLHTAVTAHSTDAELTWAECVCERYLAQYEYEKGNHRAGYNRFRKLLLRIETQPESARGKDPVMHAQVLIDLAECLIKNDGQYSEAEFLVNRAHAILNSLLEPSENQRDDYFMLLNSMGNIWLHQGQYAKSQKAFQDVLQFATEQQGWIHVAGAQGQLGLLALHMQDYAMAEFHFKKVLSSFQDAYVLGLQDKLWHNLGAALYHQGKWQEAEQYYRKSLEQKEWIGDKAGAAMTCNQLATLAHTTGHFLEAENWLKRALELDEQAQPGSLIQAGHLGGLAGLLAEAVRDGRASKELLAEARRYGEQALTIAEQFDNQERLHLVLRNLATIASLEGRPEAEQAYLRREQETRATFTGSHYAIYSQWSPFVTVVTAAALGNAFMREEVVEKRLPNLEPSFALAVQHLLVGERDEALLTKDVHDYTMQQTLKMMLKSIRIYERVRARILMRLPRAVRSIMEREEEIPQQVWETLSPEEQHVVATTQFLLYPLQNGEALPMLQEIVDVATGHIARREWAENTILRNQDLSKQFRKAVQRIWAGERDPASLLAEDLHPIDVALIYLALDIIAEQEKTTSQQPFAEQDWNWTDHLNSNQRRREAEAPLHNIAYRRSSFFTGREHLLTQLRNNFSMNGTNRPIGTQAIIGPSGIGKTQVVLEYAYRYRDAYRLILWVDASTRDTLISDFAKIARLLRPSSSDDENITMIDIKRWLSNYKQWLLIFDNSNDIDLAIAFLPTEANGHILITTRSQTIGTIASSIVVMEGMGQEEGALLLLWHANLLPPHATIGQVTKQERMQAEDIVTATNGLPLALTQAGAYIQRVGCELSDYLNLYRRRREELMEKHSTFPTNYHESFAVTWSLSFQEVEKKTPAAVELLQFCAFLAPASIPEEIITEGAPCFSSVLESLATDSFKLNNMLEVLQSFSLIQRDLATKSFTVQRLAQDMLKSWMDEPTQRQWAERTVRAINQAFPRVEAATLPRCQRCLSQVQACADLITQHELAFSEVIELLTKAISYLEGHNQQAQAEPFLVLVLAIREQVLGPKHPDTVSTLHDLALLYSALDQYEQAESLFLRALAIREQLLGPHHPDVAQILNDLALLYSAQRQYEQAESLFLRTLAIFEQAFGRDHLKTTLCLNDMAQLYSSQGLYAQAESCYLRVLSIHERILGPDHLQISHDLSKLAIIYWQQGQYDRAWPLFLRALSIDERVLGPNHLDVANGLKSLAMLCTHQGDYKQACQFSQRALDIYEQVLGSHHLDVATELSNLGVLYHRQGEYARAESCYRRALSIFEEVLDPNHADVAQGLNNLAALYLYQGEYVQAEPLYKRALAICEQSFGPDDPRTVQVLENYNTLLQKMKNG